MLFFDPRLLVSLARIARHTTLEPKLSVKMNLLYLLLDLICSAWRASIRSFSAIGWRGPTRGPSCSTVGELTSLAIFDSYSEYNVSSHRSNICTVLHLLRRDFIICSASLICFSTLHAHLRWSSHVLFTMINRLLSIRSLQSALYVWSLVVSTQFCTMCGKKVLSLSSFRRRLSIFH